MTNQTTQSPEVFLFHTHSVRIFPTEDQQSFFAVASDVASALDYPSAHDMVRCVDEEDVGYADVRTPGGVQRMLTVNESGIYAATFRSRKASAKAFRRWVTAEVLPSIRRTGGYTAPVRKAANGRLLVTRRMERQVLEMFVAEYSQKQMAVAMKLSPTTINLLIHGKYQFSPLAGEPECSPALIAAVIERHRQIVHDRFVAEQQRVASRYLCDANNQALARGLNEVGRAHLDTLAKAFARSQMAEVQ